MAEASTLSKTAGRAGSLMALVGILIFFLSIFSFVPRGWLFVSIALIVLSLVAYFVQEFGPRR